MINEEPALFHSRYAPCVFAEKPTEIDQAGRGGMVRSIKENETFEKCSILVKVNEGENFHPPVEINQRDRHQYLEYFED